MLTNLILNTGFEKLAAIPVIAGYGAHKGRERMLEAGMSLDEMDKVQTILGGAARGVYKPSMWAAGGGLAGAAIGGGINALRFRNSNKNKRLGEIIRGLQLGAMAGAPTALTYGAYRTYQDEVAKGQAAAAAFKASRKKKKD